MIESFEETRQLPTNGTSSLATSTQKSLCKSVKYAKLDIVLVKFNDGGLWPSIIILKMKKGRKYKIASLYEKIVYNVEASTIQDFISEDFESAFEKVQDESKKNILRGAMIEANRLTIANETRKQEYIDEVLAQIKNMKI